LSYSEVRSAIAELVRVDDVKDIRDKAIALREYAIRAKDRELAADAAEYRARSERRLGELMDAAPKAAGGGHQHKAYRGKQNPDKNGAEEVQADAPVPLAAQGIDKNLAKAARGAAAMTDAEWEQHIVRIRRLAHALADGSRETVKVARAEEHQIKLKKRKKRHEQIALEAGFAAQVKPLEGQFALIYADPPWTFDTRSDAGKDRSPDNHYPVLSDDSIADIEVDGHRVAEFAAKDAVLLLWCTSANLKRAIAVMERWGFEYKSQLVWDKQSIGTGYWFRSQHEILLLGTRGSPPPPIEIFPSIITAEKTKHSAKPPEVREMIERMFSKFDQHSRIELFYRGEPLEGWTCWGNEAADAQAPVIAPSLAPSDEIVSRETRVGLDVGNGVDAEASAAARKIACAADEGAADYAGPQTGNGVDAEASANARRAVYATDDAAAVVAVRPRQAADRQCPAPSDDDRLAIPGDLSIPKCLRRVAP
jgi:N6-adenosine-specific RNA methylase IME4